MAERGHDQEIASIRRRLAELAEEREALEARLEQLLRPVIAGPTPTAVPAQGGITAVSPAAAKVALFRDLFAGRTDVFPIRWENAKAGRAGYAPACANEWVLGVCGKPRVKCGECPNQAFIPVSDGVVEGHLRGEDRVRPRSGGARDFVAGVYPLLPDETCRFLAADFDGADWARDALAYLETCRLRGIPAALERSRSGEGGHVWVFFAEPAPAREARQLGALLLTATMERRPEIGFASYDRLFPSQDTLPAGGFGNLIALPLQRRARARGHSLFVDDDLRPFDDQWAFLSSLRRLDRATVTALVAKAETRGAGVLGVRMPVEDEDANEPWLLPPSRRREPEPVAGPFPERVEVVLADGIYLDRSGLPAPLVARLVRLAAFQNPEFYRAQAMRLSTFGKGRIISCAELHPRHVALPRGCLDEALELFRSHGIRTDVVDRREAGTPLAVRFLGVLRAGQAAAVEALSAYDCGVLAATTAFGKTVVAAALIARRGRNTLVLVHRRQLVGQWVERLRAFLSLEDGDVGVIGGGKRRPSGRIDVALIQSLVRKGEVSDLIAGYGHLVVDECHHLSAVSFELVARRSKARHVLGLSATVARKDGHHPIIFMQCGPVRHQVDARSQAARRAFAHLVRLRETGFRLPPGQEDGRSVPMPAIYGALAADEGRNALIVGDVLAALEAGRHPVLLTERRDHLERLRGCLEGSVPNLVVLRGGMSSGERRAADAAMQACNDGARLVLATGRYLGEGFDDPRLDTLFLTMPISWKGTLAQYVGRLHREHRDKSEVVVHDYVDAAVPALTRMAAKRQAGYRGLGYIIEALARDHPTVVSASGA
jgi:superfamily II DNA or RNA helicase